MRSFFILLFFPLISFSQEDPVSWNISFNKLSDTSGELSITAKLDNNWYLYAEEDLSLGIESLSINLENDQITTDGPLAPHLPPVLIDDPVFNAKLNVFRNTISFKQKIIFKDRDLSFFKISVTAFVTDGKEFVPVTKEFSISLNERSTAGFQNKIKLSSIDLDNPTAPCGDSSNRKKSVLTIFLLGLAGGLLALLTPCVFPMMPVTVSYFTGKARSKNQSIKNGLLYGAFIIAIYLLASIPFHLLNNVNPQIFNTISTNAWVNVFFFAVFVFFALSFFGLFEITLPARFANKTDSKSGLASVGGIFFMALTLAIVSFSCTGPILGSLLVGSLSSQGGAWQLTAGMAGFGLALALPFALFAMFPQWLKLLPKSGNWLDTVKKVLAFLELALAFKFLSNADLVQHWGILKREVFIAIWLLISLSLALYLFGAFNRKMPRPVLQNADKIKKQISWPKKFIGLAFLLFAIYLVPGLTQSSLANLKLLSGFAPPLSYSVYGKDNVKGKGLEPNTINDYDKALELAKQQNKPLLIDFTGWACVNCRKMDEHVWPTPEIASIIKEKYILVSLYVDDRQKLPSAERFIYTATNGKDKEITSVGDKWATFQAENFNQVTQPLYVILSPEEKLMNNPVGYTPSINEYKKWLQCGLQAFEITKRNSTDKILSTTKK